jgi:antitoxin MazE
MRVSKWGDGLAVCLPKALAEIAVEKVDKRAEFLKRMEQFRWPLPEGYKFDRDEANKR